MDVFLLWWRLTLCILVGTTGVPPSQWCLSESQVTVTQVTRPLEHSEGPHWDEEKGVLFFVDIHQKLVNRFDPVTGEYTFIQLDGETTLVVPVKATEDKFVAGVDRQLVVFTWDGTNQTSSQVEVITTVEEDRPGDRFNDGKADVTGRMWAGTMGPEPTVGNTVPYQGAFYSLDTYSHDAEPHVLNVSISNGLAWNAAGDVLYWIDTPTLNVYAFDFDVDSAEISNQRSVFNFTANNVTGFPDGMTIDSDGNLWVACFSGGQVINVDPRTSRLLQTVKIPAERVTSAMFGGPQLDTLFVTTSRFGLTDDQLLQQPLAGSVFAVTGLGVHALAPANKAVRPEALIHHTL